MKDTTLCSCGHQAGEHFKINGKCSRYIGPRPCPCGSFESVRRTSARRGTTNRNQRGSSHDRRARKLWLLMTFQADYGPGWVRCYRCGGGLTLATITVDRIIPGAKGGTYRRNNIRPACARCNSETGGAVRG